MASEPRPEPPPRHPEGPAAKKRANGSLEEHAESIKGWGPLAFAVAAADRPELHDASASPANGPGADLPPARATSKWGIWIGGLAIFALVASAAAAVAWRYFKP
jgi:hypothetical protein